MATCPICGKESTGKEITVDGKKLINLCNTCHSFIICLIKPVSYYSKTNAQNWAQERMKKVENIYIRELLEKCYNYSLTDNPEERTEVSFTPGADPSGSNQLVTLPSATAKISTKNTRTVKALCYLSIILMGIVGAVIGAPIDETFLFVGLVVGLLVGALLSAFTMMFVEISENLAINARSALKTEQLLEEIKNTLKNSEK